MNGMFSPGSRAPQTLLPLVLMLLASVLMTDDQALGVSPEHEAWTAPRCDPQSGGASSKEKEIIAGYFDMLDFCRTEAWGRPCASEPAVRERALQRLCDARKEIDAATHAALARIPAMWAALQKKWAEASKAVRERQRKHWRVSLLSPNPLLPPPKRCRTFRSEGGSVRFEYPREWFTAQTEDEDTQYLFLGPRGGETSWAQASNPATSPPGALFVITPLEDDLGAARTPVEGARLLARRYVLAGSPRMKIVNSLDYGGAGFVVLSGRFTGRKEPSFCWVGMMPYGSDRILVCRMIGPLSQAASLLPAFTQIVVSAEINPPGADSAGVAVALATSMIGNAVVNSGWSH